MIQPVAFLVLAMALAPTYGAIPERVGCPLAVNLTDITDYKATVTVTNNGAEALKILKDNTVFSDAVTQSVTAVDATTFQPLYFRPRILYKSRLDKLDAADFQDIMPEEVLTAKVDIADLYRFKKGRTGDLTTFISACQLFKVVHAQGDIPEKTVDLKSCLNAYSPHYVTITPNPDGETHSSVHGNWRDRDDITQAQGCRVLVGA